MSINPRLRYADNYGWSPCIPPDLLGRALNKSEASEQTKGFVRAALALMRSRLALEKTSHHEH